jgi:hypothetical protein
MAKQKYCETLKPGFYLEEDMNRCYYITGTTKGNKWIDFSPRKELTIHNTPFWNSLMWNAITPLDGFENMKYSVENPTDYDINNLTVIKELKRLEKEARKR